MLDGERGREHPSPALRNGADEIVNLPGRNQHRLAFDDVGEGRGDSDAVDAGVFSLSFQLSLIVLPTAGTLSSRYHCAPLTNSVRRLNIFPGEQRPHLGQSLLLSG